MNKGDIFPNFILKDQNGKDFELYKNLSKPILLVFYPKDNTPVCSSQLSNYNANLDDFIKQGLKVIGISTDSVQSHLAFCGKLELNFPLLSDKEKKVSKQYDAINFLGMNKRILVLIGTNKRLLWKGSTPSFTYMKPEKILHKINGINLKEMT